MVEKPPYTVREKILLAMAYFLMGAFVTVCLLLVATSVGLWPFGL